MSLTPAQNLAIKNAINADPVLSLIPASDPDGAYTIADALNLFITDFMVWRTNVSLTEVGNNFNAIELGGLTTANTNRLLVIAAYQGDGVNASKDTNRKFFDDIFSGTGGALTRAALLALWKRQARRIEKILATGTGTDASPAIMGWEGIITPSQIAAARV